MAKLLTPKVHGVACVPRGGSSLQSRPKGPSTRDASQAKKGNPGVRSMRVRRDVLGDAGRVLLVEEEHGRARSDEVYIRLDNHQPPMTDEACSIQIHLRQ